MSVMTRRTVKVLLPRAPHEFWRTLRDRYPDDPETWRGLAMLALREDARWTLGRIARAFGRTSPEVERCLAQVKREMNEKFLAADALDPDPDSEA